MKGGYQVAEEGLSAKLESAFVSSFRDNSSFGLNILGPLCLWQCFFILYDIAIIVWNIPSEERIQVTHA